MLQERPAARSLPKKLTQSSVKMTLDAEVMKMSDTNDTLCILCQHSCRGGCSWSEDLKPVNGWIAEANRQGYRVISCPLYIKETAETILPSDIDTDGMLLLLEAAAKQMREDYITGHGKYEADKKNVKKRMTS